MDTSQYLDLFLDESREHLQSINASLLQLEEAPENLELVQSIFRSAHTLKGMAATMGFEAMTTLTHRMENVLDAIRHEDVRVTGDIVDICFDALDGLSQMVDGIASGGDGHFDIEDLTKRLDQILTKKGEVVSSPVARSKEESSLDERKQLEEQFGSVVVELIEQARESGLSAYHIQVELEETCQLKGVRAFMVYQTVDEHGDIVATDPVTELLQEGQFDQSFSLVVLTQNEQQVIQEEIEHILEVKQVQIASITLDPSVEEMASIKDTNTSIKEKTSSQQEAASKTGTTAAAHQNSKSIRVNLDRLDALMNLFEELIIERGRLEGLSKQLKEVELTESVERLIRTSTNLRDVILNLRMVPIEQVFNRFPRMVRSVAKDLNKHIRLEMTGQETELDRIVLDEIGDPLVHLLRNSMDHGIESPDKRTSLNKPEEGVIQLRAYHQSNHVFIEIEDDGAGIDRDKVLKKAISNGLVAEEEALLLTDKEVYQLLFQSGFSTAEKVSDLSGRGVGLDVVKNKIQSLGGQVEVSSVPGKGSLFSIQLPMTLSIISAMLFKVSDETYALPLASILETQLVTTKDILKTRGNEMLQYRERVIPFIRLNHRLGLPVEESKERTSVLIIQKGSQLVALTVDRLIGQQEIVIKSLGDYFKFNSGFSGATILGDGSVSLILDPMSYFN